MKDTRGKDIISFIDKSGRLDQGKLKEDLDAVRDSTRTRATWTSKSPKPASSA